jgi:cation:H+ antiporter
MTVVLLLVGGLALLIAGAEALVRGSSRLAAALGISPLIVGLTVVAFGTSSPELAVSMKASLAGETDLAVGNVVGSNIFNVLFILGLAALITPLAVSQQLVRVDVPIMIGISLLILLLALDGVIAAWEGLLLVAGLAAYMVLLLRIGRKESAEVVEEYAREYSAQGRPAWQRHGLNALYVLVGLGLLVWGSRLLVESAVSIAAALGVSELIIGLTIVAAGTSMPEVVTSVVASIRGERDIAVGNVVGSNIFNILGVLGIAAVVSPSGIAVSDAALRFDIPVMIAVALACLPIFFTGHLIARWEGGGFLGYYIVYTLYLILGASGHDALPVFSAVLLWFIIPLTAITLLVVSLRAMRGTPPEAGAA